VLRRFRDAVGDHPEAQIMLAWIQDLYRIDQKATDLDERGRLRSTESQAVLDKMRAWLLEQQHPKSTTIGGAVRYTVRQWERLTAFVQDPVVWLDNNPTERALRGPVVGRRNHFGSKSVRGTEMAAILYSLVETAKVCGLDPIAYMVEVATRARRTPGAVLLPRDFKTAAAAA
jgi:transposase